LSQRRRSNPVYLLLAWVALAAAVPAPFAHSAVGYSASVLVILGLPWSLIALLIDLIYSQNVEAGQTDVFFIALSIPIVVNVLLATWLIRRGRAKDRGLSGTDATSNG